MFQEGKYMSCHKSPKITRKPQKNIEIAAHAKGAKKGYSKLSGVSFFFEAIFNGLVSGFHAAKNVNKTCCYLNFTNTSVSNSIRCL